MHQSISYQHPELEPYSRAVWKEIGYSWAIALGIVTAVLMVL